MKCCSRYTLGVVIGSVYILTSLIVFILMCVFLVQIHTDSDFGKTFRPNASLTVGIVMGVCLVVGIISGLLVWGITKRRHNCLLPFIIIYGVGFIFSCLIFAYGYLIALVVNAPTGEFIALIFISIIITVLQIVIFCFFIALYRSIRRKNINKPRAATGTLQVEYQTQPCHYSVVSNK
ncbi:uncharacterized protein LOC119613143 [Lucilia sericata]|uniref:uncharacterized protein LOC119613143 n=1 Tax=Lucilia sericata TaxID=13632 RepID=UPI0018A7EA86|nr:uncharacterized protein LOC119613143 [Lucilia sericata]XP_037825016.1 uncharacterized protein LOC119613143 [Lucilia sericata]